MAMSEEARAEYDKAMTAATLKRGTLVVLTGGYYGWSDSDVDRHLDRCTVAVPPGATVQEDSWHEFMGTFYEGDTTCHGIAVTGVTCECGAIGPNRSIRWQANMQEVAEAVFEEAFGKKGH